MNVIATEEIGFLKTRKGRNGGGEGVQIELKKIITGGVRKSSGRGSDGRGFTRRRSLPTSHVGPLYISSFSSSFPNILSKSRRGASTRRATIKWLQLAGCHSQPLSLPGVGERRTDHLPCLLN